MILEFDHSKDKSGKLKKWVDAALRLHDELNELLDEISGIENSISAKINEIFGERKRVMLICRGSNGKYLTVGKPYTLHTSDAKMIVEEVPAEDLAKMVIIKPRELRTLYPELYDRAVKMKIHNYRKIYYSTDYEEAETS